MYLPGHQICHRQLLELRSRPGLAAHPVDHQIMQCDDADQLVSLVHHRQRLDLVVGEQVPGLHGERLRRRDDEIPRHHLLAAHRAHSPPQGVQLGLLQQLLQILAADVQQLLMLFQGKVDVLGG